MIFTHKLYPSFKFINGLLTIVFLWAGNLYAADIKPENTSLVVIPKSCVALRQGQTCYQEVTFKWQQEKTGNYCLVDLSTLKPIKCWQQVSSGEFSYDFQSNQSTTFALRKSNELTNLASALVTVSWVYQSSKRPKSSWRLF